MPFDLLFIFLFPCDHFAQFPQWNFDLYFLASIADSDVAGQAIVPGTRESEAYLWGTKALVTLELTHNYGTESDDTYKVMVHIHETR